MDGSAIFGSSDRAARAPARARNDRPALAAWRPSRNRAAGVNIAGSAWRKLAFALASPFDSANNVRTARSAAARANCFRGTSAPLVASQQFPAYADWRHHLDRLLANPGLADSRGH